MNQHFITSELCCSGALKYCAACAPSSGHIAIISVNEGWVSDCSHMQRLTCDKNDNKVWSIITNYTFQLIWILYSMLIIWCSALPVWHIVHVSWSLSGEVEAELLHTYSRIDPYDTLILCVRVAVLTAVTLTVPIVLFPVSLLLVASLYKVAVWEIQSHSWKWLFSFFSPYAQVRRAIQQMMFPNKTFYWPRHIAIAFVLLTFINLLVIFAPNILGIFGVIGRFSLLWDINTFTCTLFLDLPKVD